MAFIKVVTNYAIQKQQECVFSSEDLDVAYLALGDANGNTYTPTASQTALVREVVRVPITNLRVKSSDQNSWIFDALIPSVQANTRFLEMGVFNGTGHLLFISQCDFIMTTSLDGIPCQTKISGTFELQQGLNAVIVDPTTVIATENYVSQNYADRKFLNLLPAAQEKLHALKGYEDAGELLTDKKGLVNIIKYAHSFYDSTNFSKTTNNVIITTDGIASGFTANDYINISAPNVANYNNWAIIIPIKLTSDSTSIGFFSIGGSGVKSGIVYNRSSSNNKLTATIYITASDMITVTGNYQLNLNTQYYILLTFTGTKYIMRVLDDNYAVLAEYSTDSTNNIYSGSDFRVGLRQAGTPFTGGVVDLKGIVVIGDNTEIFNGNPTGTDTYTIDGNSVSISYKVSKTGSKIADSSQRTNITALYNQQGYTPYYTLDEVSGNFTLPCGEIYGMLENVNNAVSDLKREFNELPHIISSYSSATDWYDVYSNGKIRQGGIILGSTQNVAFPTPILNSNGTIGGTGFAVSSSSAYSGRDAFKVFNGSTTAGFSNAWMPTGSNPNWIEWYYPSNMTIPTIRVQNSGSDSYSYVMRAGKVQYSNDGVTWYDEQEFTNDVTTNYAYWDITINNPIPSKYKRIYITSTSSAGRPIIHNLQFINATVEVAASNSVTYLKPFTNENYSKKLTWIGADGSSVYIDTVSNTGFTINSAITSGYGSWVMEGY